MEYLIRFAQFHENFRLPELQSLAALEGIDLEVVQYSLEVGRSITRRNALNLLPCR